MARTPADAPLPLHWFPVFVAKWLTSDAITLMEPEQEGAYFRLLLVAWGDGSETPRLPTDDASLAKLSRLRTRWRRLGGLVRAQFEERDGHLVNSVLTEVWEDQQKKHAVAVARGAKGGRTRAANLKSGSSSTTSPTRDRAKQSELEGAVETLPLTGQEFLPAPAPSGAPALADAAPRSAGATSGNGAGDYLDRPSTREALARVGVRPDDVEHSRRTDSPAAQQRAELEDRESAYTALLNDAADDWITAHRTEAIEIGDEQRKALGLEPRGSDRPVPMSKLPILRACVVEAIRAREGWPSAREWDRVTPFAYEPQESGVGGSGSLGATGGGGSL